MASITTILILIAAITAISGKPLDFGIDTDQPSGEYLNYYFLISLLVRTASDREMIIFKGWE